MKKVIHPLEEVFDIEQGSMSFDNEIAVYNQNTAISNHQPAQKDEEDEQIDENINKIFEAAMEAYENQTAFTEIVEPKFAARNAEVAAQYLSLALSATALKSKTKNDRRKNAQYIPNAGTVNNNVIVADRNSILDLFNKS